MQTKKASSKRNVIVLHRLFDGLQLLIQLIYAALVVNKREESEWLACTLTTVGLDQQGHFNIV